MWGPENIWLVAFGGFCAFLANVLYAIGGTDMAPKNPEVEGQKWVRRFVGSAVLALGANVTALVLGVWAWQYLWMFPALAIGFSLPYGSDNNWVKAFKRFMFALGVLSACLIGLYVTGFTLMGWLVFGIAFAVGMGSIALGVFNPFNNAPLEQYLICQLLTMFVPFWAFIK